MPKEGNPQVFICLDNKLLLQSFFLPNNVSAAVFFISSGSSKQFDVKEKQPYFSTNVGAVSLHFQLRDYRASCNDWQNPVPWMSLFLRSQISAHWTHMEVLTGKTALWKWWMEEGAPTGCGGGGGAPLSPRSCHHHTLISVPSPGTQFKMNYTHLLKVQDFSYFIQSISELFLIKPKLFPKIHSPAQESFLTGSSSTAPDSYTISQFSPPTSPHDSFITFISASSGAERGHSEGEEEVDECHDSWDHHWSYFLEFSSCKHLHYPVASHFNPQYEICLAL